MDLFHIISEDRIKKAYKNGEFDHLSGFGKPLELEDLSSIPEELRVAYKLLKNAGYIDEENSLRKELMTIEDLLKKCDNESEKEVLQKKLNKNLLRFNQLMAKRGNTTNSAIFKNYELKMQKRFK